MPAELIAADRQEDRRHAARVVLGLLVPGLILLAAGHPALILYAAFGSFAGMYGRLETARGRLRHQFHGAGMIVTGVALGVTLAQRHVGAGTLILAITAFATIGSLLTDLLRLRPGGPFFGIFALGATATVDPGAVGPWGGLAICAATAAWSLALGLLDGPNRSGLAPTAPRPPVPGRPVLPPGSGAQAVRHAVATSAAGLCGLGLGIDHANWAMTAAAVPLAVVVGGERRDLGAVVHRAGHRVAGTLVGLVVSAAVLLPEPGPVPLAIAVMALLFPTELFMARHYGVALGFFTPLIMIMTELAAPSEPVGMLVARGVDTVIGVAAGVAAAALITGARPARHGGGSPRWAG